MTDIVDALIADLNAIDDRASLLAFMAPLRCPDNLGEFERARLTSALIRASVRCWKRRLP
jgi:hypothetical protein